MRASHHSQTAGFTLLEMMAVLVIIGILAGAFLSFGGSIFDQRERETRVRLTQLSGMLESYRSTEGDYPNDRLPAGASSDPNNSHAEALFVAFFDADYHGTLPDQDWLVNTDGDASAKPLTRLPVKDLFEIGDSYGNPIYYCISLHYDRPAQMLAGPEEEHFAQTVAARQDLKTGAYEKPNGFQLISAGEDGEFGTEDDIANFEIE